MRLAALTALLLAFVMHPGDARAIGAPSAAFVTLRTLIGEWRGETASGRTFEVSYRLIANDTVLIETWTLGPGRQSMTVYHMDGEDLIATHYCPIGNQPRLQFVRESASETLSFTFRDATNLSDPNQAHQHAFWIRVLADGSLERNETYVENGAPNSETTIFRRQR